MIVAVLIPSYGRPEQLRERVTALLEQEQPDGVELRVIIGVPQYGDQKTRRVARSIHRQFHGRVMPIVRNMPSTAVDGWLRCASFASIWADWLVLGADDIVWGDGWLTEALRVAEATGAQVIGLNDGHTDLNHYAPHYMMTTAFAERYGFIPKGYHSWWFDRHVCEMAAALGLYAPAWKAIAEHMHPDWHTAPNDATYDAGRVYRDADKQIYLQAKANGFGVQRLVTA